MRPVEDLVKLLRHWKSRDRKDDFEEIARRLEDQQRLLNYYKEEVEYLNRDIDKLKWELSVERWKSKQ